MRKKISAIHAILVTAVQPGHANLIDKKLDMQSLVISHL